jgi:hypothetical protein
MGEKLSEHDRLVKAFKEMEARGEYPSLPKLAKAMYGDNYHHSRRGLNGRLTELRIALLYWHGYKLYQCPQSHTRYMRGETWESATYSYTYAPQRWFKPGNEFAGWEMISTEEDEEHFKHFWSPPSLKKEKRRKPKKHIRSFGTSICYSSL